jgi:hypothetical protein
VAGRQFSSGTTVSSSNDITEILLRVALNTIKPKPNRMSNDVTNGTYLHSLRANCPNHPHVLIRRYLEPFPTISYFQYTSKLDLHIRTTHLDITIVYIYFYFLNKLTNKCHLYIIENKAFKLKPWDGTNQYTVFL